MIDPRHSPDISYDRKVEDWTAAILSILPGLGHLFKGYYALGLGLMLVGFPLAAFVGILIGFCTLGIGLILPLAFWIGVMGHAYCLDSKHYMVQT
jgi:hypothetical protein